MTIFFKIPTLTTFARNDKTGLLAITQMIQKIKLRLQLFEDQLKFH